MKTPNCIETALTAAFRARGVYRGIPLNDDIAETSANQ
jgi:hypothetical protein